MDSVLEVAERAAAKQLHLDLQECLEIAHEKSPVLVRARRQVSIAGAGVVSARAAFLPNISVGYSYGQSIQGPREGAFLDPATGLVVSDLSESTTGAGQSLSAGLSVPIYSAGSFIALESSRRGVRLSRVALRAVERDVALQVKSAYFELLRARQALDVQADQLRLAEETQGRTEKLYELGDVPLSNVLTARSNVERVRADGFSAEHNAFVARTALASAMGLETDVEIVPTQTEFYVEPVELTFEEALDRALSSNPGVVSARLGLRQTLAGIEDLLLKNYGYSMGISVSMSIFDGLGTESTIKIQKLNYLQALDDLVQLKRGIETGLRNAFAGIRLIQLRLEANRATVRAAEEDFKLQDQRYNFGQASFQERQQGQIDFFSARMAYVQSIFDYQLQVSQLEQLIGGEIEAREDEAEDEAAAAEPVGAGEVPGSSGAPK